MGAADSHLSQRPGQGGGGGEGRQQRQVGGGQQQPAYQIDW